MIEEQEPLLISQRYSNGYIEQEYQVYADKGWAIYRIRKRSVLPAPISPFPYSYGIGRVDDLSFVYEDEAMTFESAVKKFERILKENNNESKNQEA